MRAPDESEAFVVTRNGVPVGDLIPVRRRRFVSVAAVLDAFRGAPPVDASRFREDLDRFVDQDAAPRA